MNKIKLLPFIATLALLLLSSCEKDQPANPVIPNEEELITSLSITLTPVGGGTAVVLSFQDLDGEGGNPPVITGGTLEANTNYTGSLQLLNELENPVVDITEEVEEEATHHQFFYQTTVAGLSISYADADDQGKPLGLATTVSTTNPASGTLTVILRHEPDKAAPGVSNGDITNAGGETDIEVTFDVEIQ